MRPVATLMAAVAVLFSAHAAAETTFLTADRMVDVERGRLVENVGVLIEDGRVADFHTMSIGEPVSGDTLFQMASVSKWVTAW